MIIVYILAVIGGLSVLGAVALVFLILINTGDDRNIDPKEIICARTMQPCIYQDTTDEEAAEKGAQ